MTELTKEQLWQRAQALEKTLILEQASADLMDECLKEWATNMREMARHNIQMSEVLQAIVLWADLTGLCLPMRDKAIELLFLDDED